MEDSLSENSGGQPGTLLNCLCPLDIWGHVAYFVDPVDLLSLRKTCKVLYKMTQRRFVWLQIAKRVCFELGLFEKSFPFDDMTTGDLEHLALSPSRVGNWVSNNDERYQGPLQTRLFSPRPSRSEAVLEIHGLELVPGGRYLITYTVLKGVYLWDLGYNTMIAAKSIPLAHLPIPFDFAWWPICPTEDRKGIQITFQSQQGSHYVLEIYEVYPVGNDPQIRRILCNPLNQEPQFITQSHKYVAFMFQPYQEVHIIYTKAPLVQGVAPSLSFDLVPDILDIALFDNCLVAFAVGKALVVEIPSYDSLEMEGRLHATRTSPPHMALWQPTCDGLGVLATDEWKGPAFEHLLCPMLTQDDTTTLHLYQMVPLADNPSLPPKIPVGFGKCQSVIGERGEGVDGFREADARVWRNSTHFYVLAQNRIPDLIALQYEIPKKQLYPMLYKPNMVRLTAKGFTNVDMKLCNMCFATGRLVAAVPPPAGNSDVKYQIHVMDYFAPASFYS
ncbi:hypothetical protein BKA70DRAFT_1564956 [Coprinopsis sp. MPI-PUGE-AT-0042]|nr:hypothetical protein BKA70DRAFT_1564956 [Coprinopsis sp. MPI-PUGE-AT-0042]